MSANSKIEWTDHTFNPWWGCQKVSPGCDNCYAERDAGRYFPSEQLWGDGSTRRIFGETHWREPLKWNRLAALAGKRSRVFCASMADVFDKDAPKSERARLWSLIEETPSLDWLLLTKRVGNVKAMLPPAWLHAARPNVWLGISVVNQAEADRDIPKLLAVPARIRFLSCEPLLGPIDLHLLRYGNAADRAAGGIVLATRRRHVDWVIVGGESGPKARPMHPQWPRDIRDQCLQAGVSFHFKQWGEWGPLLDPALKTDKPIAADPDFGDFPMARFGKHAAGRKLDGRTWDQFPSLEIPHDMDYRSAAHKIACEGPVGG